MELTQLASSSSVPHGEENKHNYDYDHTHEIPCEIRKKRPQEKEKKGIVIRTLPLPQRGETRDDEAGDESAGALARLCLFRFCIAHKSCYSVK